jgi:hypothetical protein
VHEGDGSQARDQVHQTQDHRERAEQHEYISGSQKQSEPCLPSDPAKRIAEAEAPVDGPFKISFRARQRDRPQPESEFREKAWPLAEIAPPHFGKLERDEIVAPPQDDCRIAGYAWHVDGYIAMTSFFREVPYEALDNVLEVLKPALIADSVHKQDPNSLQDPSPSISDGECS